jgi:hypothetical protein
VENKLPEVGLEVQKLMAGTDKVFDWLEFFSSDGGGALNNPK